MNNFKAWGILMVFGFISQMVVAQTCTGNSTRNIVVENCSATAEASLGTLRIFPNPASDVIVLQNSGEKLFFDLLDPLGRVVLGKELPESMTVSINVAPFPKGVYLAKWRTQPFGKAAFLRIEILR